jgi:hypothetical protein
MNRRERRGKEERKTKYVIRVHLILANIFVGAKHFGIKSLVLTNKLSAEMLRPCQNEMHPMLSLS